MHEAEVEWLDYFMFIYSSELFFLNTFKNFYLFELEDNHFTTLVGLPHADTDQSQAHMHHNSEL